MHIPYDFMKFLDGTAWICSLACQRHADLLASGSCDGFIKLWEIRPELRSISRIASIPMVNYFQ